ncbi:WD40 repeat domain-containing protein [Endozoicomonas acroporae]|uniref:WD40 repeat domain-containing protein n=1 Tax=Endozoicomonas acroporae TaxID=1701104 RepID=UPI000C757414|nr:WD40 repeat domain-containing protein [Endozoicomonas acroporae]
MQPIAQKYLNICFSGSTQSLCSLQARKQVISFGRVLSRAAASRIETGEWQLFNHLKPLCKSLAAYNKNASKVPEPVQIEWLKRLKLNSPPEATIITAIGQRKLEIIGLNISMMQQSSEVGQVDVLQQRERRNIPCDNHFEPASANKAMVTADAISASGNTLTSMNSPSTDDSDTESAFQTTLVVEAHGNPANIAALVNDLQLHDVALKIRQPCFIDPMKADTFQCQTNYLKLKLLVSLDECILDVRFGPTGKNLVIMGCDDYDDSSLGIWQQGADGNWLQKGLVEDYRKIFRCQLNRLENTLLSSSDNGIVTVNTLNSDGRWVLAEVLEHTPTHKNYPKVQVAFSPLQDKIMSWDPQTGKINVLREDSNGRWTPLTQTKEICHFQQCGPQQPLFKATNNYLLTYQGTTATIWNCSNESNCLVEKKVIECNRNILSAQLSDDEQHALILTEGPQVVFQGCDLDGNWSQIGEICHPESRLNRLNNRITNVICNASFNASGQYALTLDADDKAIISGYDDDGVWGVKTEIQGCAKAEFSPSGRKLLARLFQNKGQTLEHSGISEAIFSLSYGNFQLWNCNSTGGWLDKGQTLEHSGCSDVIFSPSENLLLSYGNETNFACIWGDDEEGNLVEKAKVGHQGGIDYAAFNTQEDSVLTRSRDRTLKITALNSQGKWQEQLVVQDQSDTCDARFSLSGYLAYTISLDETACILGRDDSGKWVKQAVTTPGAYSVDGAQFNELDNHFLIYGNKTNRKDKRQPGLVQLWGIDDDGKWAEKEQIKLDYPVKLAKFSPDSDHLVIQCHDKRRQFSLAEAAIALLWKIPASPGKVGKNQACNTIELSNSLLL